MFSRRLQFSLFVTCNFLATPQPFGSPLWVPGPLFENPWYTWKTVCFYIHHYHLIYYFII